jgi:hypothetical protein
MKIAAHNNSLKSNIEVESQNFGIGDASVVIEILRNRLYQHKIRTLVQEYMCNARDAHREVSNPAPIQVAVPNQLSPTFRVRDFGPGISPDRIRDVFVMYGASTKRGTNKQTGGFGIGAKSAWSYTDSFTIVSYVDGKRRTYVAHTGVNNNGRLDLIETVDTIEPNGTEIQVAVKQNDIEEFRNSIFRACYFWQVKPKFTGLVDVQGFGTYNGERIGNHLEVIQGLPDYLGICYGRRSDVLVCIDGVPYVTNRELIERVPSLKALAHRVVKEITVLHIGNGVLEVSASRESLADSKMTLDNLEKLAKSALKEAEAHIASKFKAASNVTEFLKTYHTLSKRYDVSGFAEFDGYKIEQSSIVTKDLDTVMIDKVTTTRSGSIKRDNSRTIACADYGKIYYQSVKESQVITNRRIRTVLAESNAGIKLLWKSDKTDPKAFDKIVKDFDAVDLSTIKQAAPLPRAATAQKAPTVVTAHNPCFDRSFTSDINLDTEKTIVYVEMIDGHFTKDRRQLADLKAYLDSQHDVSLVGLAPLSIKRVKGLSNFISLESYLENFKAKPKDLHIAIRTLSENFPAMQVIAKAPGVKCKFFASMQQEYVKMLAYDRFMTPKLLLDVLEKFDEVKTFKQNDRKLTEAINSKYKLLKMIDQYTRQRGEAAEWVEYINAKS